MLLWAAGLFSAHEVISGLPLAPLPADRTGVLLLALHRLHWLAPSPPPTPPLPLHPASAANGRHQYAPGPKSPGKPALDRVGLYHYAVKSIDDFKQKMARGSGMGNVKTLAFLKYVDNFTNAYCADALDVGLQLHMLMALQEAL